MRIPATTSGSWALDHGDRTRVRAGWTAFLGPYALGVVGWLAERRAPPPGQAFHTSDLVPIWWSYLLPLGLLATCLVAFVWLIHRFLRFPTPKHEGEWTLTDDFIVIRQEGSVLHRLPRRDVVHVDASEPSLLGLRLRDGRRLALRMSGSDKADWAAALRDDVGRRAERIRLRGVLTSGLGRVLAVMVFGLAMAVTATLFGQLDRALLHDSSRTDLTVGAVAAALQLLAAWGLRHRTLVVGAEGLRIDGLLRSRFVSFAEIATIEQTPAGATLHLHDGRRVRLPRSSLSADLVPSLRAAHERARAAAAPVEETSLARGDADTTRWTKRLKELHEGSYRHAPLRIDTLESIVENPRQSPEQRVAAAVALSVEEEGRQRVREAAEATAERELQAALEAAAEGAIDERRLARAQRRFGEG